MHQYDWQELSIKYWTAANNQLKRLETEVEAGRILMMIDVPRIQVDEIEVLVSSSTTLVSGNTAITNAEYLSGYSLRVRL